MRRYISVEDVASRYGWSPWTVYEKARHSQIPHRKLAGSNRLLFEESALDAWDDGAELQVKKLPRGGRVVTPVVQAPTTTRRLRQVAA
jgi:predicted DNA-binding transcriptional regulator AlpA